MSNAHSQPSLPHPHELLEDSSGIPCSSIVTAIFKTGPLDDSDQGGKEGEKKIHRSLLQHGNVLLGKELSDAQGIVSSHVTSPGTFLTILILHCTRLIRLHRVAFFS